MRAVGDPAERFREDYLRILRAVRFAARFGFEIDPATWEAARAAAPGLARLSAERVRDEWLKGLRTAQDPGELVRLWIEVGAASVWLPELLGPARPVDRVAARAGPRDPVRLTAVYTSDPVAVLSRLKACNAESRAGERDRGRAPGARGRLRGGGPAMDGDGRECRRRSARDAPSPARGRGPLDLHRACGRVIEGTRSRGRQLAIDGRDVQALGASGPRVGDVLSQLLDRVLDRSVTQHPRDPARTGPGDRLTPFLFALAAAAGNLVGAMAVVRSLRRGLNVIEACLAFGAGFMLSVAVLGMLPEVMADGPGAAVYVLVGYLAVHLAQHVFTPHFHFGDETHRISHSAGVSALIGLMLHTFFDGVAIASGFLVSGRLGVLLFLAVLLHKLPEGVTIASVILAGGGSRRRAIVAAGILGLATVLGRPPDRVCRPCSHVTDWRCPPGLPCTSRPPTWCPSSRPSADGSRPWPSSAAP